ncbi:hypothetical protein EO1_66 [Escherichia phage EO1]|nr:hypothetical protein EO1_66 [Escherichia phage EO1]
MVSGSIKFKNNCLQQGSSVILLPYQLEENKMRLQRQSIKDSEVRGKWYFNIIGKDSELIEKAEHLLRDMGWEDECDGCPLYEDGESAGFWIYHSDVEQFKADWKIVKKSI